MALVLDAGAFIFVDRNDRRVLAMLRVAQQERLPVRTSGAVVAQVWRNGARPAHVAMVIQGVDVAPLDDGAGRAAVELLRTSRTSDVVDGHIAVVARQSDTILTSDPTDIAHLLGAKRFKATRIVAVWLRPAFGFGGV